MRRCIGPKRPESPSPEDIKARTSGRTRLSARDMAVPLVGSHFKKLSADVSPGFDGIPIPFLNMPVFPLSAYLKHAAKKLKPQQSPRVHAVFIDSSQAYETAPRLQLWDHLQCIAMPAPLLWAIKEMYQEMNIF
eukprot:1136567-Pelagomonas_calceolata.AAC.6